MESSDKYDHHRFDKYGQLLKKDAEPVQVISYGRALLGLAGIVTLIAIVGTALYINGLQKYERPIATHGQK